MSNAANHYQSVMKGRRSKAAGAYFEEIIDNTCRWYSQKRVAEIMKTPEPMRPIKSIGGGKFIAYYERTAQPDYKGTLNGGKAIVFEAKHTDRDRLLQSAISYEQGRQLDSHQALGAICFVLISFRFERFYKVPWSDFKSMKELFGHKYLSEKDLEGYEIKLSGGVLRFL